MTNPPAPSSAAPAGLALPELLAPAGHWEALRAAAANGADAIYFGVEAFNARMRAANFQRFVHDGKGIFLGRYGTEVHGAQAKLADLKAGASQLCIFHVVLQLQSVE